MGLHGLFYIVSHVADTNTVHSANTNPNLITLTMLTINLTINLTLLTLTYYCFVYTVGTLDTSVGLLLYSRPL